MDEQDLKKQLLATQLKANDGLKSRIMHQINAEQSLLPQQSKATSLLKEKGVFIFSGLYVFIALIGGYFYISTKENPLLSPVFLTICCVVASIFSVYWLFTAVKYAKK